MVRLSRAALQEWASRHGGGAAYGGAAGAASSQEPSCRLGDVIDMTTWEACRAFIGKYQMDRDVQD